DGQPARSPPAVQLLHRGKGQARDMRRTGLEPASLRQGIVPGQATLPGAAAWPARGTDRVSNTASLRGGSKQGRCLCPAGNEMHENQEQHDAEIDRYLNGQLSEQDTAAF